LPEASPLLKDFYVPARDSNHDEAFYSEVITSPRIIDPSEVAFVEGMRRRIVSALPSKWGSPTSTNWGYVRSSSSLDIRVILGILRSCSIAT